jgi:hypothetical protein
MPSSTSSFERPVPKLPWATIALGAALLSGGATIAWEVRCRVAGYLPTLNDTVDLWSERREAVQPDSVVIIGDSRPFFDLDLDQLERGLGQRPVQLALPGSGAYPILADLAADQRFHGTVICSIVPGMFMAPGGPLIEHSEQALKRYRTWNLSQRVGHQLGMLIEERFAFLEGQDLTLAALLRDLPIPNRPGAMVPPRLPSRFSSLDRERRARMIGRCERPGKLQDRIKQGWLPLFTPPPPPRFVPREAFLADMAKTTEARFRATGAAVQELRARGGKVVFVRFPFSGELKKLEDRLTPRSGIWSRLLRDTNAPGIYFEDFPELATFDCPEWSHLSAGDSVEFTKRLAPHLKQALGR